MTVVITFPAKQRDKLQQAKATLDSAVRTLVARIPQRMWANAWPATCGRDSCHHVICGQKRRQAELPCGVCHQRIEPGQSFFVVSVLNREVRVQMHESCATPEEHLI